MTDSFISKHAVSDMPPAAILAGGEGRRFGRAVKPLITLAGKPLIACVIDRIRPQSRRLAVVLREPASWPRAFDLEIVTDVAPGKGPLSGLSAALAWAADAAPALLTCPADSPFMPLDLSTRLAEAMTPDIDIAVAASGGRRHHLTALWRTALYADVNAQLAGGTTAAVHELQARHRVIEVTWPVVDHDPFFNINTPGDLTKAEGICSSTPVRGGTLP